jgi:hypothetical protein
MTAKCVLEIHSDGFLIYTNKNGLYSTLWNLCVLILQGSYEFNSSSKKIVYKHPAKFYKK